MSEQNKRIVRRAFEEVYNQGKLDAVAELVSGDFLAHMGSEDIHGPACDATVRRLAAGGLPGSGDHRR